MVTALVDFLEEKCIITYDECETRIMQKIEEIKVLTKFENLDN